MMKYIIIATVFLLNSCRVQEEEITYYDNSKVISSKGQKKDGKMTGKWEFFYPSGKIKSVEHFLNDNQVGEYKKFYETGELKMKGNYSNEGTTIEETTYDTLENNEIIEIKTTLGCRVGTWEFYDVNGKVTKKNYKDCKEQKE